jgi:hypothetical protein
MGKQGSTTRSGASGDAADGGDEPAGLVFNPERRQPGRLPYK